MSLPAITEVLLHRGPMLFLDELIEFREDAARCRFTIRPDMLFVEGGRLPCSVTLEHMAQCVGAFVGMWSITNRRPIRTGYLIGIREAVFHSEALSVGEVLEVEARCVWGDTELGAFACRVERAKECLATSRISVYGGDLEGRVIA